MVIRRVNKFLSLSFFHHNFSQFELHLDDARRKILKILEYLSSKRILSVVDESESFAMIENNLIDILNNNDNSHFNSSNRETRDILVVYDTRCWNLNRKAKGSIMKRTNKFPFPFFLPSQPPSEKMFFRFFVRHWKRTLYLTKIRSKDSKF